MKKKTKRNIGQEILEAVREIKAGKGKRTIVRKPPSASTPLATR